MTDPFVRCEIAGTGHHVRGRITAELPASIEEVWTWLVEPQRLPLWLAPGEVKADRARIDFGQSGIVIESPVTRWAPPAQLAYSWSQGEDPARPVCFELAPSAAGVRLSLSVQVPAKEDAARAMAGWACHLEMLAAAVAGVPIGFPVAQFKANRLAYATFLEPA